MYFNKPLRIIYISLNLKHLLNIGYFGGYAHTHYSSTIPKVMAFLGTTFDIFSRLSPNFFCLSSKTGHSSHVKPKLSKTYYLHYLLIRIRSSPKNVR